MTDWPAIIIAVASLIASTGAAVAGIITAMRMGGLRDTVNKVETNTNSMSERLAIAAGLAGEAKGRDAMRAEQAATAGSEAKGRADEKASPS